MNISDIVLQCSRRSMQLAAECRDEQVAVELHPLAIRLLLAAVKDAELIVEESPVFAGQCVSLLNTGAAQSFPPFLLATQRRAGGSAAESHLGLALAGPAAIFDAIKYSLSINRQKAAKGVARYRVYWYPAVAVTGYASPQEKRDNHPTFSVRGSSSRRAFSVGHRRSRHRDLGP